MTPRRMRDTFKKRKGENMASSKKDFTQANSAAFDQMERAITEPEEEQPTGVKHPRTPYSEEKVKEMQQEGTTQGRKGCKALRINMAFSPEVHKYIKTMARVRGETITEFTNWVFHQSMEINDKLYQEAKIFREGLK